MHKYDIEDFYKTYGFLCINKEITFDFGNMVKKGIIYAVDDEGFSIRVEGDVPKYYRYFLNINSIPALDKVMNSKLFRLLM